MEWISHLPHEEVEAFVKDVNHWRTNPVTVRFIDMMRQRYDKSFEIGKNDYTDSWSHKQAHTNGMRQAYHTILGMLEGQQKNARR